MQSSKYYDTVFHLKKEFTKSSLVLYLSFVDLGVGTDTALLDTKSVILKPLPVGDHVIKIDVGQRIKNQFFTLNK